MSIGLLTSTIQVLKRLRENADPLVQSFGDGITSLIKPGTDYTYLSSRKSRIQLIRLSAVVCGIELCYAAETAFVSPILLKLGVPSSLMTLVWCISPLLGFFLVPILGSMSDNCTSPFGRRRPFIVVLSVGVVLGLLLVPNGESFGLLMGDGEYQDNSGTVTNQSTQRSNEEVNGPGSLHYNYSWITTTSNSTNREEDNGAIFGIKLPKNHVIGIILTVVGVALLDFSCDAAQSPSRAYLLDISVSEDHSTGLTTFTVMAGLGGCIGYVMGGVKWNLQTINSSLQGHVRIVFSFVLVVFVIFLLITITSFKEVPLHKTMKSAEQTQKEKKKVGKAKYKKFVDEDSDSDENEKSKRGEIHPQITRPCTYGTISDTIPSISIDDVDRPVQKQGMENVDQNGCASTQLETKNQTEVLDSKSEQFPLSVLTDVKLKTYLISIVKMPKSILILCITNLFCWMSLVCYSLFFTDFVGQAVYGGDPHAPAGSVKHKLYDDGVRLGSFGMSLYSLSCALYSLCIERLVDIFKAKRVYITGQLVYTVGMIILASTQNRITALILSPTAGIMYATLFTMPYLLIAHYHTHGKFTKESKPTESERDIRGLGTDIAVVSSMVFLAQLILSAFVGTVVDAVGSTVAVIVAAAILSFLGAVTATQVEYLDL